MLIELVAFAFITAIYAGIDWIVVFLFGTMKRS